MSQVKTGVLTHDASVNASEGTLQAAIVAAGGNQATANAASIAHYRACVVSGLANKCGIWPFMVALKSLGVNF